MFVQPTRRAGALRSAVFRGFAAFPDCHGPTEPTVPFATQIKNRRSSKVTSMHYQVGNENFDFLAKGGIRG